MVSQIKSLGANYAEWVNKPVDRPLRLFDSELLEMLTKTPWWLVPGFWLPIIAYLINIGIVDAHDKHASTVCKLNSCMNLTKTHIRMTYRVFHITGTPMPCIFDDYFIYDFFFFNSRAIYCYR